MGRINTYTFRSILEYLSITKNSNTINTWLLGMNFAILFFLINNFIKPTEIFEILLKDNIYFKITCFSLFVWLTINVSILIIFSYKEKILSLAIEDNYYRLKSFMSYMSNIKDISDEELLNMDLFEISDLTIDNRTKIALKEYVTKIFKYNSALVKWSNKRLLIYKFVILASIPLLVAATIVVFYHL